MAASFLISWTKRVTKLVYPIIDCIAYHAESFFRVGSEGWIKSDQGCVLSFFSLENSHRRSRSTAGLPAWPEAR